MSQALLWAPDRFAVLSARLRATEARLGIERERCWEYGDESAPPRRVRPFQRVYVGRGALFVTFALADARAVIEHYGGEGRVHAVELCGAQGDEWARVRLCGGRWIKQGKRGKR